MVAAFDITVAIKEGTKIMNSIFCRLIAFCAFVL